MQTSNDYPWIIYGTAWKKDRTADLVYSAVKAGFRAIDTANQPKHYNEPGVGAALNRLYSEGLKREELFLQTKFTSVDGQDHRIPYDSKSDLHSQVLESFGSSLDHLETTYLDSLLLHGPYHFPELGKEDWEVWTALTEIFESGKAKNIGVSNVNYLQLELLIDKAKVKPMAVQNRCYANQKWDSRVREICRINKIPYQGFSLLTANPQVVGHAKVLAIADRYDITPEQTIFAFSRQLGVTPLTGTTSAAHLAADLRAEKVQLTTEEVELIEELGLGYR